MKKIIFVGLVALMGLYACDSNKASSGNQEKEDSIVTEKEVQASTDLSEKESVLEETSEPKIKAIEFSSIKEERDTYQPRDFADYETTTITVHLNMEDGSATITHRYVSEDYKRSEIKYDNTTIYEGSWKSHDVKRGNSWLNGYDIQCSSKDGDMEIYTTEKFDYMYFDYSDFYDGKTGSARKIINYREIE